MAITNVSSALTGRGRKAYTPAMFSISRLFSNPKARTRSLSIGVCLLLVYFLFFSIFALHHIYVANELDDSHGCAIGEWIHLGQQAAVFFLFFTVCLLSFNFDKNPVPLFIKNLFGDDHPKRGPPLPAFLAC